LFDQKSANSAWGIIWGASFALSAFFVSTVFAEGITGYIVPIFMIFILPLVLALSIWIFGVFSRFKTSFMVFLRQA